MNNAWSPRKPYSFDKAQAEFKLLADAPLKLKQYEAVQEQWPNVLKRDGKISCRALQEAVGFDMLDVSHYMRILHGLNQTDTAVPPEPEPTEPEASAPGITKLTAEMRKLADEIDGVSQESITTRVHEATERAHSASEAQIRAAEAKIVGMSAQIDDLDYTNDKIFTEAKALADRVVALTAENVRLVAERDDARAEVTTMTTAKTLAEQQHTALRTEIADVRAANQTLAETLAEVKQERDTYRHERDDHQQTAGLVPDLRLELAKCKAQLEGRAAEVQQYRSNGIRMSDEHARELTQVRQEHKRTQDDAQRTITELQRLLSTLVKHPVDA